MALNWHDRFANYEKVTGFPAVYTIDPSGVTYAFWKMGNDYRVKSEFYGGYPATYLRRVRALFPEKENALHVFSGMVDQFEFPGHTVDINADLCPTYLDDAQSLELVPVGLYDIVLADPPYSVEDAERYQTTMVKRNLVTRALAAKARPGTHLVWLDQVLPMYRKDEWAIEAHISIIKSTNHRFRIATVFRRLP